MKFFYFFRGKSVDLSKRKKVPSAHVNEIQIDLEHLKRRSSRYFHVSPPFTLNYFIRYDLKFLENRRPNSYELKLTLIVRSFEAVAINCPLCDHATPFTASECPVNLKHRILSSVFHKFTDLSVDDDANLFELWLYAKHVIGPWWPRKCRSKIGAGSSNKWLILFLLI